MFVHTSALADDLDCLRAGMRVSFEIETGGDGRPSSPLGPVCVLKTYSSAISAAVPLLQCNEKGFVL